MKKYRSLSKQAYIDYASMSHNPEDTIEILNEIKNHKDLSNWVRAQKFKELRAYVESYKNWVESVLPADQVKQYLEEEPEK